MCVCVSLSLSLSLFVYQKTRNRNNFFSLESASFWKEVSSNLYSVFFPPFLHSLLLPPVSVPFFVVAFFQPFLGCLLVIVSFSLCFLSSFLFSDFIRSVFFSFFSLSFSFLLYFIKKILCLQFLYSCLSMSVPFCCLARFAKRSVFLFRRPVSPSVCRDINQSDAWAKCDSLHL